MVAFRQGGGSGLRVRRTVAAVGRRGMREPMRSPPARGRVREVEARAASCGRDPGLQADQPAACETWSCAVWSADLMSLSETVEPVAILANMSFIALPTVDSNWSSAGTSGSGFALLL